MSDNNTVKVPTKSQWESKINIAQVVGVVASLFTVFGIDIDAQTQVFIVMIIQGAVGVLTWIFRTWFTTKMIN